MRRRLALILFFLILYTGYVVLFYNSFPGKSYIYEQTEIEIDADIPPESSLVVSCYTHNNPFSPNEATPTEDDSTASGNYRFRIPAGHLPSSIKIYFSRLSPGQSVVLNRVSLRGGNGSIDFPMDVQIIAVSEVLDYEEDNTGSLKLTRKEEDKTPGPSVSFKLSGGVVKAIMVSTDRRDPVWPGLLTGTGIVITGLFLLFLLLEMFKRTDFSIDFRFPRFLIYSAAFLLPLGEQAVNLLFIIAFLWAVIQLLIKGGAGAALKSIVPLFLLAVALVVLYSLSLLVAGDNSGGASIYNIKIALPLILLSMGFALRSRVSVMRTLQFFIAGSLSSVIIHIAILIIFVSENGFPQSGLRGLLYASETFIFSRVHHSYLAMGYALSISALLFRGNRFPSCKKWQALVVIVLAAGIILSWSRAGLIALIFLSVAASIRYLNMRWCRKIIALLTVAVPASGSVLLIMLITGVINIPGFAGNLNNRVTIWENSIELIGKKPLAGYGIAGFNRELDALNNLDLSAGDAGIHFNAHNQFIETAGMFGVPAAIIFIWILFIPAIAGRRDRYRDAGFITAVVIVIFFLFETFLNRNLGVTLVGFIFAVMILITIFQREITDKTTREKTGEETPSEFMEGIFGG